MIPTQWYLNARTNWYALILCLSQADYGAVQHVIIGDLLVLV
jgi:hypothetical protein